MKVPNIHQQRLRLAHPYIGRFAMGFVLMLVTVVVELAFPKAIAFMIDNVGTEVHTQWLGWLILGLVVVFALQSVALGCQQYMFESTGNMIVRDIRQKLYHSIINKNISFFDRNSVGELCNRLSSDVELLQDTLSSSMAVAIRSVFVVIGGVVLLITISPSLSIMILIIIPVSVAMAKIVGKQLSSKSRQLQARLADNGSVAQENFSNIRLVHAFNQKQKSLQKYQETTNNSLTFSLLTTRLFSSFQGGISFVRYLALLIILWVGAGLISSGEMTVGGLTSFVLYTGMVATSATAVSSFWGSWMRSIGATERVFDLMRDDAEREQELAMSQPLQQGKQVTGNIQFNHVRFAYPSRPDTVTLQDFNLNIRAGEKVALVGSSGAGKSTIASLLLGFYQPNQGQLLFDGVIAQEIGVERIREHIAIVEQEPALFSGSILENIAYSLSGKEVDLEAVVQAAKQANADDFILSFPEGYDTLVGERGVQLSGGQKQRIAIARALIKDPRILILDEATSALDSESEHQVQQALEHLMQGRTTIMIAHRLSTVVKADRIVVMEKGRIIQEGKHEVLSQQEEGLYSRLMRKQLQTTE